MRHAAVVVSLALPAAVATAAEGEDLFDGRTPIAARLRGETPPLPPAAARCANCHEPPPLRPASGSYAPRLDRDSLTQARPRRGGPPSLYDERTFCRALREGVDPAEVLLRRVMPVFAADDAQCRALWQYLSVRAPDAQAVAR